MGGRGLKKRIHINDQWEWLQDVEDTRLKKYIKRSRYIGDKSDPKGRSIHDVAYHAEQELKRRT